MNVLQVEVLNPLTNWENWRKLKHEASTSRMKIYIIDSSFQVGRNSVQLCVEPFFAPRAPPTSLVFPILAVWTETSCGIWNTLSWMFPRKMFWKIEINQFQTKGNITKGVWIDQNLCLKGKGAFYYSNICFLKMLD